MAKKIYTKDDKTQLISRKIVYLGILQDSNLKTIISLPKEDIPSAWKKLQALQVSIKRLSTYLAVLSCKHSYKHDACENGYDWFKCIHCDIQHYIFCPDEIVERKNKKELVIV